jgi:hypothetical protein
MEPGAAIAVIETDLRHLVRVVLSKAHGPNWLTQCLDSATLAKLNERQEEEGKRRSPAKVSGDPMAYTHLYELRKIVEKDWEQFVPALGEKREFVVLMDKVEDFRNAPAHSRELLPYERSLLDGIAGSVRTMVTQYVSSQAQDARHYPVIESIRDSFGNEPESLTSKYNSVTELIDTGLVLQVGDEVQFEARGWDPQGRALTWRWGAPVTRDDTSISGSEVHFVWSPTENDVGRSCFLVIELLSTGPYHRGPGYDQQITFLYQVEPPTS